MASRKQRTSATAAPASPQNSANATQPLTVGMIFECGPQGADKKVCEYLLKRLKPTIQIKSITLDNKPNLVQNCGASAAQLLSKGCDRVIIIWDLYPAWREKGERPCRREDRQAILKSLKTAAVDLSKAHLVCITEELEAWFLADGRALSSVLSRPTHSVTVRDSRKPETAKNPKAQLTKLFKEKTGRPYSDLVHADKIVQAIPDFAKIKRCETFKRFALKAADIQPEHLT